MRFNFINDDQGKDEAIQIAENLKSQRRIIAFCEWWNPFNVIDDVKKGL